MTSPFTRRAAAGLTTLALLAAATQLPAACIPLPSADLRTLDRDTDDRPERVVAEVTRRLAEPGADADSSRAAQLHAIAAEAHVQASNPGQVHAEVDAGLKALESVAHGPERQNLATRLQATRATEAALLGDGTAALRLLDPLLAEAKSPSVNRSCLLAARSLVHLQSRSLGDAAADAIEAYEIAGNLQADYARMNAAYMLAAIYSRAGLNDDAEKSIAEVIEFADQGNALQLQMIAAFLQARVFNSARKIPASLAAARRARELALLSDAPASVAAATVSVCIALAELSQFGEFAALCGGLEPELRKTQRTDLIAELNAQRARMLLARGSTQSALALLDAVLREGATPLGPVYIARYLRYRVAALEAAGNWRAANADLHRAESLEDQALSLDRVNAVIVIGAMNERIRGLAGQRALQSRIEFQKSELEGQRRMRNLSIAFAIAASLLVALLAVLLQQTRRERQVSRRQHATLSTIVNNAPDALLLLDRNRTVMFGNHRLFGGGAVEDTGDAAPLENLPRPVRTALQNTLDTVYEKRAPASGLAVTGEGTSPGRYYEVHGAPVMENGDLVGVVVRAADVTANHRLEREVVDASNRERSRLSRDLHEGIGQQLAGTMLLVRGLAASARNGTAPDPGMLASIETYLAEAIGSARALARDLSPVAVDRGSLGDALSRLASDETSLGALEVDVSGVDSSVEVNDEAADHLYRIAREALGSALERGANTHVGITLAREGDNLVLSIEDDCSGSDGQDPHDTLGMRMVEYRARLLGGAMELARGAEGGRRLRIMAPWSCCRRTRD